MGKREKVIMFGVFFLSFGWMLSSRRLSLSSCDYRKLYFHSETPCVNDDITCISVDGSSRVW